MRRGTSVNALHRRRTRDLLDLAVMQQELAFADRIEVDAV
jgi:hypothetical protein